MKKRSWSTKSKFDKLNSFSYNSPTINFKNRRVVIILFLSLIKFPHKISGHYKEGVCFQQSRFPDLIRSSILFKVFEI
ncbi:hypothetical protein ACET3Z_030562 [Daucus carota]